MSLFELSFLARVAIPCFFKRNLWLLHLDLIGDWNLGECGLLETLGTFEKLWFFLDRCFRLLAASGPVIGFIRLSEGLSSDNCNVFYLLSLLNKFWQDVCLLLLDFLELLFNRLCFFFLFCNEWIKSISDLLVELHMTWIGICVEIILIEAFPPRIMLLKESEAFLDQANVALNLFWFLVIGYKVVIKGLLPFEFHDFIRPLAPEFRCFWICGIVNVRLHLVLLLFNND